MNNNIAASIIVLNYNGEVFLEKTLSSLQHLDYSNIRGEVIIIDNNSQDKSREVIEKFKSKFSILNFQFSILYLPSNLGFAGGNNQGIKIAKGKYIILLNNDCVVEKNWLTELVKTAEKNENIFAVNSKIMLANSNKIQNAGITVFQDGYGRDIGTMVINKKQHYDTDTGQFEKEREVYAACGAAVLYRKSVLEKIGYFDESFFMYYEDVEICERARLYGYKTMYCPKAIVHHYHAQSSKEWSPFFNYHAEKGRLIHVLFHFPFSVFIKEYISFLFSSVAKLLIQRKIEYIKATISVLLNLPILIKKRIRKHKDIKYSVEKNYQKIKEGGWYFT
jgi:GT2 family glycosyltransferase